MGLIIPGNHVESVKIVYRFFEFFSCFNLLTAVYVRQLKNI